ncbi:MAG: histidine phosphatase family protein [Leptolyngbya sp. SIO1D8]|nr:histidine phosphatase family protein [Leptolyngbya sp. SIO1D8]
MMIAYLNPPQITELLPGYELPSIPSAGVRVILLRHGRSTLNEAKRFQDSSNRCELTAQGVAAAQAVGRFLACCPIDAVLASPAQQTQETVTSLLPYLKASPLKQVEASSLLREIDLPAWNGLCIDDVRSQQPTAYRCWRDTPDQFQMAWNSQIQSEETVLSRFYPVREAYERARQFWQSMLLLYQGKTVLVVSHGGTNQALINTALGLSARQHHVMQQTPAGLTILDFKTPTPDQGRLQVLNLIVGDALQPVYGNRLPKFEAGKQGLRLLLLPCQAHKTPLPTLATLLQGETVQAAVVEDGERTNAFPHNDLCHQTAQALLKHNSETVVFSVQRSQFWYQWQAAIQRSLKAHDHSGLTTVLAVAQSATLKQVLKTLLILPRDSSSVALQPNTLSVVHYPSAQDSPILQGLNLSPLAYENRQQMS